MLFNGGGCEQSDNIQELAFTCEDFNGGPPTNLGDEVHIFITDSAGNGMVYFDGIVRVGDFFPLNAGGQLFADDQFITISTPDQGTTLQGADHHSCWHTCRRSGLYAGPTVRHWWCLADHPC